MKKEKTVYELALLPTIYEKLPLTDLIDFINRLSKNHNLCYHCSVFHNYNLQEHMGFINKILHHNPDPTKFQTAIDNMDRVAKSSFQWCKITPEGDIVAVGLLLRIFDLFKNIFTSKNDQLVDCYDKSLVELRFLQLFENCVGENILCDLSDDKIKKIKNAIINLRTNDSIKHKELEEVANSVENRCFRDIPDLYTRFLRNHPRSDLFPLFGRVEQLSVTIPMSSGETRDHSRTTEPDSSTTIPCDEIPTNTEETSKKLEEIPQAATPSDESIVLSQETAISSATEPDSSTTIPCDEIPTNTEKMTKTPIEPIAIVASPNITLATSPSLPTVSTPPVKLSKRPSVLKTAFLGLLAFSGLGVLARNYLNTQTSIPLNVKHKCFYNKPIVDPENCAFLYVGPLKYDQPDGWGKMSWSSGDDYSGEFVDGLPHGQGTYTWSVKPLKYDQPDGFHEIFWSINQYSGEFVDGLPHGQGTYTWSNGEKNYTGSFVRGEAHDESGTISCQLITSSMNLQCIYQQFPLSVFLEEK